MIEMEVINVEDNKTLKRVKQAAGIAVSIGVGAIVGNAVKFTTPTSGVNQLTKACIGLGTVVLGGLASEACIKHTEKVIDETAQTIRTVLEATDDKNAEEEIVYEA